MPEPKSYCEAVADLPADSVHRHYHDRQYGFPLADDNELFGRLLLEINQAGLSWTTILNKQDNFRQAYARFNIAAVAAFGSRDEARLLADAGIVRNRLKVKAAIHNARRLLEIQAEHGSFRRWLADQHPLPRTEWVKLFRQTFKFTGGEITNEFLLSTGYLKGAHAEDCPVYGEVLKQRPPWCR